MIIKNKLGTFDFDDNTQISHAKLIANTVMGQYFTPKRGTPHLSDEESCYSFVRDACSVVICEIPFELEINESARHEREKTATEIALELFEKKMIQALKDAFPGSRLISV